MAEIWLIELHVFEVLQLNASLQGSDTKFHWSPSYVCFFYGSKKKTRWPAWDSQFDRAVAVCIEGKKKKSFWKSVKMENSVNSEKAAGDVCWHSNHVT